MHEGGIRIPFLVQWKDQLPAGITYDHPVISLDIFATAAALANSPPRRGITYDGANLIPCLTEEKQIPPHEQLFWRAGSRSALRAGNWKLVQNGRRKTPASWELYDLDQDLAEEHNLAQTQPNKLKELRSAWDKMNQQMIDPVWVP
jgi:arylsulfatase B